MKMTAPLMAELHRDHVNIVALARVAEGVLQAIEADDDPDYELLEDAMRYITGYSDATHHPNEDIVFEVLERRAPEAVPEIEAIAAEHDRLVKQGRVFLEQIEALKDEAILPRAEVLRSGRVYFAALHKHMSVEESMLFPLADRSLTEADWHEIRERILVTTDPLFGPTKDANFRRLWQRIAAHQEPPRL
jgi:hemerythrin-like domain-containing protein